MFLYIYIFLNQGELRKRLDRFMWAGSEAPQVRRGSGPPQRQERPW
jgi:hypothetical protein